MFSIRQLRSMAVVLAAVLVLGGCGAPSVASYMRPPRAPRGETVEGHVSAAREAWKVLADRGSKSEWPAARERYNQAVAAVFDDLRRADSEWQQAAVEIGTRVAERGEGHLPPELLGTVFPASKVDVSRLGKRQLVDGVGLPVVGWIDDETKFYSALPYAPPTGAVVTSTAVLRFDRGPTPTWEFRHPYHGESIRLGGVEQKLEVDWSAAHALYWRMSRLDKTKIENVLRPERLKGIEGVFFGQALDTERIPVLFVHGLKSTADAFAPMINELAGEEWFRRNYQVWLYSYPTGLPWTVAASDLRENFGEVAAYARGKGVRNLDRTVVIGHSMGGLITQASLREPGDALYSDYFSKPIDSLDLRQDERQAIRDVLMWEPIPQVSRAMFLAAPHRGSPMADETLGSIASMLIKLPKLLTVDFADLILRNGAAVVNPEILSPEERLQKRSGKIRFPTGIESLSPERPVFQIVPKRPFRSGVTVHSVIGDRGLGDTPESSDGVVPYWSSHLDEAASEKIVPSDHSVPYDPDAIEEVKRVLKLHAGE